MYVDDFSHIADIEDLMRRGRQEAIDDFVDRIEQELRERGWSMRELARRADLSASAVSYVLGYQNKPGWAFCAGVAQAFGWDVVTTFRDVGLLPPAPEEDELTQRLMDLIPSLSVEDKEMLCRIAELCAHRGSFQE